MLKSFVLYLVKAVLRLDTLEFVLKAATAGTMVQMTCQQRDKHPKTCQSYKEIQQCVLLVLESSIPLFPELSHFLAGVQKYQPAICTDRFLLLPQIR